MRHLHLHGIGHGVWAFSRLHSLMKFQMNIHVDTFKDAREG